MSPRCLGASGVRAREQHAPLGVMGERRPHLLAGHDVRVAVQHRARLQGRQVRARLRLAEPLAPHLVGAQDRRQEPRLLLVRPVRDDGRPAHREPEHVGHLRRPRSRELLEQDRLLDLRRARPAVLGRPRQPGPAALVERPLPVTTKGEGRLVTLGLLARVVVGDPRAQRVAEFLLRRRKRQVHAAETNTPGDPRSDLQAEVGTHRRSRSRTPAPVRKRAPWPAGRPERPPSSGARRSPRRRGSRPDRRSRRR